MFKTKTTRNGKESNFIPWGLKARKFLYDIMCGEIPSSILLEYDLGAASLHGGQIKCVISDMRTSDELAKMQRKLTSIEITQSKRQMKLKKLRKMESTVHQVMVRLLRRERELAKKLKEEKENLTRENILLSQIQFRLQEYFGNGNIQNLQTITQVEQDLINALRKTTDYVQTQREIVSNINAEIDELRQHVSNLKRAQVLASKELKETEADNPQANNINLVTQVEKITDTIHSLFKKRRLQMKQKKNVNDDSNKDDGKEIWEASFPSYFPRAVKDSLWQKLHHRRFISILRPNRSGIMAELNKSLEENFTASLDGAENMFTTSFHMNEKNLQAEQLLLLALHPESPYPLLSSMPPLLPSSNKKWAEPGWHVVLENPEGFLRTRNKHTILPRHSKGSLLNSNISQCNSAPGRQAAYILKTNYLKNLQNPMTTILQGRAPAEVSINSSEKDLKEVDDPFTPSEDFIFEVYQQLPLSPVESFEENFIHEKVDKIIKEALKIANSNGRQTSIEREPSCLSLDSMPLVLKNSANMHSISFSENVIGNPFKRQNDTHITSTSLDVASNSQLDQSKLVVTGIHEKMSDTTEIQQQLNPVQFDTLFESDPSISNSIQSAVHMQQLTQPQAQRILQQNMQQQIQTSNHQFQQPHHQQNLDNHQQQLQLAHLQLLHAQQQRHQHQQVNHKNSI
mmetsp:Transcript_17416/g.24593  ORF Transcript_17416/g.24593 Transcript_17416/m.24593 type:complete len:684 (-) Transcript_17416:3-2054(-)